MGAEVSDLVLNINVNAEIASRKLKNFNKTLDDTNRRITKTTKLTKLLQSALKMFGVYLGFQGISNFVKTARELDLMERSISGLTKSTKDWNYIQNEALRTGTRLNEVWLIARREDRLNDVAKGYRGFYASASMAGFGKGQIQGMFSDVLTSTRSIGATQQQTQGALLALEQMLSKGTVSMEELRRQMGNALPGAFEIGVKAMNMTTKEFNDFVKSGKLVSNVFVPRFVKQLKKELGAGFGSAIKSLDFALNNLDTTWKLVQLHMFKGKMEEGMADFVRSIGELISNPVFTSTLKGIGWVLGNILHILADIVRFTRILFPVIAPVALLGIAHGFQKIAMSIAGMNLALSPLYLKIMAIVGLLLILQDLFYGLFLRDKGFKSLTGDALDQKDIKQTNNFVKAKGNPVKFMGLNALDNPLLSPATWWLEKQEQKNISVNVGDINIKGANDPVATAQAVENVLISLFEGRKIKEGAIG